MFESKNVKTVGKIAIVDCVREAGHRIAAHTFLDDFPTFRRFKNRRNRSVRFIEKLNAQRRDAAFVILRCLD